MIDYLLETYATDHIIAETYAELMRLTQLVKRNPIENAKLL